MAAMGFRAFLDMDNKEARQAMAGNGRKKVHRGYLVENGFSRVSRHSPTLIVAH